MKPFELKQQIKLFTTLDRKVVKSYLRIALAEVTPDSVDQVIECLKSEDLAERLLIALPESQGNPNLVETIAAVLESSPFKALSTDLGTSRPLTTWVDGFVSLWEEKLVPLGIQVSAGRLSQVLSQILSAMLEIS